MSHDIQRRKQVLGARAPPPRPAGKVIGADEQEGIFSTDSCTRGSQGCFRRCDPTDPMHRKIEQIRAMSSRVHSLSLPSLHGARAEKPRIVDRSGHLQAVDTLPGMDPSARLGKLVSMASRTAAPEKRPGIFSTIKQLITFTKDPFPWVVWVLPLILVAGVLLGEVFAFFATDGWWNYILFGIFGLMVGIIAALLTMNRLATKAMYRKLDGMQGAGGHVVSNMLGRNWRGDEMPVGINPKTQDVVYRAVGRGGVVLVGEGSRSKLEKLMKKERTVARRITHDSVPVTEFFIGKGEDDIAIDQLAKAIKKLPKAVDRNGMAQLIARTESISRGGAAALPIPKGVDPMRARAPRTPR